MITTLCIAIPLFIVVLIAFSHWWLQRQINGIKKKGYRHSSSSKKDHDYPISNTNQNKFPTLYDIGEINRKIAALQDKVGQLDGKLDNGAENTEEKQPDTADKGQPKDGNENDGRIWVKASDSSGLLVLVESEDRQGLYLTKRENFYLLHILDDNYMNLAHLYNDVVDIPLKLAKNDELVMSKHPIYAKDHAGFKFKEKGEIIARK